MTSMQTLHEEVTEALAPLDTWRFAAAIERTPDLNAACQDALTTLMWWGWAVTVTRPRGEWCVQAAKTAGNRPVKARGTGGDYYSAVAALRTRLLAMLAGAGPEDDGLADAA